MQPHANRAKLAVPTNRHGGGRGIGAAVFGVDVKQAREREPAGRTASSSPPFMTHSCTADENVNRSITPSPVPQPSRAPRPILGVAPHGYSSAFAPLFAHFSASPPSQRTLTPEPPASVHHAPSQNAAEPDHHVPSQISIAPLQQQQGYDAHAIKRLGSPIQLRSEDDHHSACKSSWDLPAPSTDTIPPLLRNPETELSPFVPYHLPHAHDDQWYHRPSSPHLSEFSALQHASSGSTSDSGMNIAEMIREAENALEASVTSVSELCGSSLDRPSSSDAARPHSASFRSAPLVPTATSIFDSSVTYDPVSGSADEGTGVAAGFMVPFGLEQTGTVRPAAMRAVSYPIVKHQGVPSFHATIPCSGSIATSALFPNSTSWRNARDADTDAVCGAARSSDEQPLFVPLEVDGDHVSDTDYGSDSGIGDSLGATQATANRMTDILVRSDQARTPRHNPAMQAHHVDTLVAHVDTPPRVPQYLYRKMQRESSPTTSEVSSSSLLKSSPIKAEPHILSSPPAPQPLPDTKPTSHFSYQRDGSAHDDGGDDSDPDIPLAHAQRKRPSCDAPSDASSTALAKSISSASAETLQPSQTLVMPRQLRRSTTRINPGHVGVAALTPVDETSEIDADDHDVDLKAEGESVENEDSDDSVSDNGSDYAANNLKEDDQLLDSDTDAEDDDGDDSDYAGPRKRTVRGKAKITKRSATAKSGGSLKRKAGVMFKLAKAATSVNASGAKGSQETNFFGQPEKQRDPDTEARVMGLRDKVITMAKQYQSHTHSQSQSQGESQGSSLGSGGNGGPGYRGFDVRICMVMVDDRFADIIEWDATGLAMVIKDFQLFFARACKYVMRKETQQSAFDKQLSNHGFTRQTFKSQSRKIIAHPKIRADDLEFWDAVRGLPRLEAVDTHKIEAPGSQAQTGSKARRGRAAKTQAELDEARLEFDVLRAENEDYKIELQESKNREKESHAQAMRMMQALMVLVAEQDLTEATMLKLGLIPADVALVSSGSNTPRAKRSANGHTAAGKKGRAALQPKGEQAIGVPVKPPVTPALAPTARTIKRGASSWSLQTLVEPDVHAVTGTDIATDTDGKPAKVEPAGPPLQAVQGLNVPGPLAASVLVTGGGNNLKVGRQGRKRKSVDQLRLVPPASPSPLSSTAMSSLDGDRAGVTLGSGLHQSSHLSSPATRGLKRAQKARRNENNDKENQISVTGRRRSGVTGSAGTGRIIKGQRRTNPATALRRQDSTSSALSWSPSAGSRVPTLVEGIVANAALADRAAKEEQADEVGVGAQAAPGPRRKKSRLNIAQV